MNKIDLNNSFGEFSYKLKIYSLAQNILRFLASSLKIDSKQNIDNNEDKFNIINQIIELLKNLSWEEQNKFMI